MQTVEINLLGNLIGILIGSLISSVFLTQSFKWIEKRTVSFARTLSATAVGYVASRLIQLTAVSIFQDAGDVALTVLSIALLPVAFFVQAGSIALITRTRFTRACLVWLVAAAVGLAVLGGIVLLVFIFAKFAGI